MHLGHRMEVPAGSAQAWNAAFSGSYDDEEIDLLSHHIAGGSFVLDVGASLGFYTIPLGRYAQAVGALVVAVEPIRSNCEVLARNVSANYLDDVVSVLPIGLGATPGTVTMHVETGGAGNGTIVTDLEPEVVAQHDDAGGTRSVHGGIRLTRMDDLDLPGRCSLIKMDVEGFELAVLAGGEAFIAKHRPTIFAECNPAWLAARGLAPDAPQRWAMTAGYTCFDLVRRRIGRTTSRSILALEPLAPDGQRRGCDLLFLPESTDAS